MYVIFPLDQLLDINSAAKPRNKSSAPSTPTGDSQSVQVLSSPSHPNLKVPAVNHCPTVTIQDLPSEKVTKKVSAPPLKNQASGPPTTQSSTQGLQRQASLSQRPVGPTPLKKKVSSASDSAVRDLSDNLRDQQPLSDSKSEIPRINLIQSDSFRLTSEQAKAPSRLKGLANRPKSLQISDLEVKSEELELKQIKALDNKVEFALKSVTGELFLSPSILTSPESVKSDIVTFSQSDNPSEGATVQRSRSTGGSFKRKPLLGRGASFKGPRGTLAEPKALPLPITSKVSLTSPSSPKVSLTSPSSPKVSLTSPSTPKVSLQGTSKMAGEVSLRDMTHPALNETLKSHNSVTFKLIKTVSDFSAQLSRLHERHAEDLQVLVENFRKKHSDLRNERPPCSSQIFQAWETLLQEVEVDSQVHSDIAGTFVRTVSRPLIENTFHRKIQSRKLFAHRESIETILGKTEEMLKKCRKEHTEAYHNHCRNQDNASLSVYFDSHNAYVQQLHATNAMLHAYNSSTLPSMLEELEEVHLDVGGTVTESILQGAEVLSIKSSEKTKRYESLCTTCRSMDPRTEIASLVKYFDTPQLSNKGIPQHRFIIPQPPAPPEGEDEANPQDPVPAFPPLKNELVLDRLAALSSKTRVDSLRKEQVELEKQITALTEGMDNLQRLQLRNIDSSLYNKANELQEDISMKRFDLRVNQLHLSAVKAQKELFASKEGPSTDSRERKMSNSSTGSMKSKWMKAFKSLKTPSGSGGPSSASGVATRENERQPMQVSFSMTPTSERSKSKYHLASTVISVMATRKNGRERGLDPGSAALFENSHILQEYTYKKITACDVCHQILRGHSRQGMKCRLCKTNVHFECQEKLPKCQPKSKMLRRQRSTSEIESKQIDAGEDETEPEITIPMLIASQPGRRMKELPSPSTPSGGAGGYFPLPPKGPSSSSATSNPGKSTEEVDLIYQVLKQAGDLSGRRSTHGSVERDLGGSSGSGSASSLQRRYPPHPRPTHTGSTLTVNPPPIASSSAPISPRRQKLNLRMKSFSLDSPESSEQRRRHGNSSQSSHVPSHCQSPSSPVHNRRLLTTRAMRMSSVELPDDNEKSLSSASTSPCPSPISKKTQHHRLLPTNLYVVLYNFTSRHNDELDLRAGFKVTVTDTSDADWWQGKCLGRTGFFPSKYVTRLNAGEKVLQVTHNLQVSDGENGIKLLRDQIVIQLSEEIDGMVMIRNGDNQQGVCPIKYLQEA